MITLSITALSRRCNAVTSVTSFCGASFDKAIDVVVSSCWLWLMILQNSYGVIIVQVDLEALGH